MLTLSRSISVLPLRRVFTLRRLFGAAALMRSRRSLGALDDARLRDIGLTRLQAETESRRPFWDAPSSWQNPSHCRN